MYISLILFFIALISIVALVARKILAMEKLENLRKKNIELEFDVPELHEVKEFLNTRTKKYGYLALVSILRAYVVGTKVTKNTAKIVYKKGEQKIKKILGNKNKTNKEKEASGFIKTMTEYKKKVSRITNRIKKEEGLE